MPFMTLQLFTQSPKDVQRLIHYADALMRSGSLTEEKYWHTLLCNHINKLLNSKKNHSIEQTLDLLLQHELLQHYEIVLEHTESMAESLQLEHAGQHYEALLFSAPITLWTRYQLPGGELSAATLQALKQGLHDTVLSQQAQVALLPELVNYDTMPETFRQVREWTQKLTQQILTANNDSLISHGATDNGNLLADARFLVGVILVPQGAPLFNWQQASDSPPLAAERSQKAWHELCQRELATMLTGCQAQFLTPNGYYHNIREADREIRPLTVQAGINWLQTAANIQPRELIVSIAACGQEHIEEYRIGFSIKGANDVIYGCIWPVLSQEESDTSKLHTEHIDVPDTIAALLKSLGVEQIQRLPGMYNPEHCDDCQAPFFPDSQGELKHPELPDEINLDPVQLH